jgi:siroheme synthase (precorrin-2 oxidase/ferrochelatase)
MKLYLIVRRDLAPGARAAQLCHALRQWSAEHEALDRDWYERSNTLVLLETVDEEALLRLAGEAKRWRIPVSVFREPDFGDAATAIALAPSGRRLVRDLPLALAS